MALDKTFQFLGMMIGGDDGERITLYSMDRAVIGAAQAGGVL
jgi:hypothetical protein